MSICNLLKGIYSHNIETSLEVGLLSWEIKSNRIQEILDQKGWTQQKLAEETSINQGELSRIINNKRPGLQLRTSKTIARALGFPVDYIWPDD
jgi:DNA-binding Xre family transcriptional regulator